MGLDTSHDCWHGAYSAFSRWRNTIAKLGGYLEVAKSEWGGEYAAILDDERWEEKNFFGEWDAPPADPLLVLLVHSDCDGSISPEHAGPLADRLEGLLPSLVNLPDGGGHLGDYVETTQRFIDGLRKAVAAGERVEFM